MRKKIEGFKNCLTLIRETLRPGTSRRSFGRLMDAENAWLRWESKGHAPGAPVLADVLSRLPGLTEARAKQLALAAHERPTENPFNVADVVGMAEPVDLDDASDPRGLKVLATTAEDTRVLEANPIAIGERLAAAVLDGVKAQTIEPREATVFLRVLKKVGFGVAAFALTIATAFGNTPDWDRTSDLRIRNLLDLIAAHERSKKRRRKGAVILQLDMVYDQSSELPIAEIRQPCDLIQARELGA